MLRSMSIAHAPTSFGIITTILVGLVAGVILATPPGVINLTIVNFLSQKKYKSALWVGAGSATLDVFYAALALYSTSAVYAALQCFIHNNPLVMFGLELLFVIALLVFGISKSLTKRTPQPAAERTRFATIGRNCHPFLLGCLLALTHILVPTFLPGYAYMAAMLIDAKLIALNHLHFTTFALMFAAGNLLWVLLIVSIFKRWGDRIKEHHFQRMEKGIGLLFLIVAILLLIRMAATTRWDALLR